MSSQFLVKLLRVTLLVVVMLGLLAVLLSKRKEAAIRGQAEQEAREKVGVHYTEYYDPQKRALTPLDIPDFGEGPIYYFSGQFPKVSHEFYQQAKRSNAKARSLKLYQAGKTLNQPVRLPVFGEIPVNKDFDERYLEFRLRELEAYRELTEDAGEVKQAGEKFLQEYIFAATDQPNSMTEAELLPLAKEVINLGSEDSLIRVYTTYIHYNQTGDVEAAIAIWTHCIEQLRESQYPMIMQVNLRSFVRDISRSKKDERRNALIVNIVRWLEEEYETEKWVDSTYHKLFSMYQAGDWTFSNDLLAGCLKSERIDPFVPHLLLGWSLRDRAWQARDGSLASRQGQKQHESFEELISKAKAHLEYAYLLRPDSPYPPYHLMSVALNGEDRDYQQADWFRRCVENQFDHYGAYYDTLYSMTPRWGGSLYQVQDFAKQCIDSNRFDTFVPYFVFDQFEFMVDQEFKNDWGRLKEFGADKIVDDFLAKRAAYRATHPGESLHGDNARIRTRMGIFLQKLGRPDDAIAEYREAQGDLDMSQIQNNDYLGKFKLCRLFAAQGEVKERVLQFDKELRKQWPADTDPAEIEKVEKEWLELKPSAKEELAKKYYAHTEVILKQLKTYFQGDWVELSFRQEDLGWEIRSENMDWSEKDQDIFIGRETNQPDSNWARPLANFEAPFHLQAQISQSLAYPGTTDLNIRWTDFDDKKTLKAKDKRVLSIGILADWSFASSKQDKIFRGPEQLKFRHRVSFLHPLLKRDDAQYVPGMKPGIHLVDWKHRKQTSEMRLGNYPEFVRLDSTVPSFPHLIFDAKGKGEISRSPCTSEFVWKLGKVRIRRLSSQEPPAENENHETQLAYWQQRVQDDPEDAVARLMLCEVLWLKREAVQLLDQSQAMLKKRPDFEKFRRYEGLAFYLLGNYKKALESFELAYKEYRDDIDVIMTLAELKAAIPEDELRDQKEASSLANFGKRCSVNYQLEMTARQWAAFAAVSAGNLQFEQAREANQKAIELADEQLKIELQKRQELYEADQPFRYPAED